MDNTKFFEREIALIVDEDLRMFAKWYLENYVPPYFWEIGASSSGKYHPCFSQGRGGLVRHTKAVVMFAEELLRMNSYAYLMDEYKDYIFLACIVHDTFKYGEGEEMDKAQYKEHARKASEKVAQAWFEYFGTTAPFVLVNAIKSHMGQWTDKQDEKPFTQVDRCVHMADYMASRAFIDIPTITEEWDEIACENVDNSDLPF